MARYFFQAEWSGALVTDDFGEEFRTLDEAEAHAAVVAKTDGFLLAPSVIDEVKPDMRVAKEEIFGPVLSVMRVKTLEEALALGRNCPYGIPVFVLSEDGKVLARCGAASIRRNDAVQLPEP